MKKTRVGVVGVGLIGRAHIDALRRIPEVELVAVCEPDALHARDIADRYGVPHWFADYRALAASDGVDAIHNCTPNAQHDAVGHAAIDHGKHIYAEKPLSNTAADARMIWQRAERAGVVHGLNHQYRMNVAVQEMRVRIQRGDMGRVFLLSGRYHQQSGLYDTDYNWRMAEGGMSCGLSDIGTHWVDLARCVLGCEIEKVFASLATVHPVRTRPDGTRTEICTDDVGCVTMRFENGAQGMLTVSKVSAGHMNDLTLSVDGQQCSLAWAQENPGHLLIGYKNRPNEDLQVMPRLVDPAVSDLAILPGGHPLGWYDALTASVREFYRAVRGDIAPSAMRCATFADGYAGMAFVEAALESNRTGRWADVAR